MERFFGRKMESMHPYIPQGKQGVAEVRHIEVNHVPARSFIRPDEYVRPGKYVHLYVHKTLMMSDTSYERRTNQGFVESAQGDVLVAGLGIGMVLLPVLKAPEVQTVTVIEKYQDVIDLVADPVRKAAGKAGSKLSTICADVLDFLPAKGQKWDVVYFDIWENICTDNLGDIAKLHKRFARRKRLWMDSWMASELRSQKRRWDREVAERAHLRRILRGA